MTPERATLDGQHRVLTPEYVEFDFVLAGLFSRFLAWLLDTAVTVALALVAILLLSVALAFTGLSAAVGLVVWFLIDWGYSMVLEAAWSGQTLGKRLLGLRVLQESGVRLSPLQAVLRNLTRPVDRLPIFYLVGASAALASKSQQRLGDMLAGTIVVRERRLKIPASLGRAEGETALLQEPFFQQRVARLTADEESLLFSAATRREELGIDARLNLFAALSKYLQHERSFDKPQNLSDEKLVLLVVAALAARSKARAHAFTRGRA
jgi:uncharacterized RDD family membrane protein YckC